MPKTRTKMGAKKRISNVAAVRFGPELYKEVLAYNIRQDGEAVSTSIRRLVAIGLAAVKGGPQGIKAS